MCFFCHTHTRVPEAEVGASPGNPANGLLFSRCYTEAMTHMEELEREFAELKQQATAIRRYL